jgi:hypothetical protein
LRFIDLSWLRPESGIGVADKITAGVPIETVAIPHGSTENVELDQWQNGPAVLAPTGGEPQRSSSWLM